MSEVIKLKYVARIRPSNVDKKTVDGEQTVRLCNYTDVYYNDVIRGDLEFMLASATLDQVRQFELRAGDVLITKDSETADDIAVPAFVAEDLPRVLCGYHLSLIRPDVPRVNPKFLFWCMASATVRSQAESYAAGVTRVGIRSDLVDSLCIPLLPVQRQGRIASYLDAETGRIDALIEKRERMINLLTARKEILAETELTGRRGTNVRSTVRSQETRRSGDRMRAHVALDEVISNVPSDWRVVPIGRVTTLREERNLRGDAPMLSLTIEGALEDRGADRQPPSEGYAYRYYLVGPGELVVNPMWITGGAIGVSRRVGAVSPDYRVYRFTGDVVPEFAHHLLRTGIYRDQFRLLLRADTTFDRRIKKDDFAGVPLLLPPREEQSQIVESVDASAWRTSQLITANRRAVGLLAERRLALITDAVTGRIEIPGATA